MLPKASRMKYNKFRHKTRFAREKNLRRKRREEFKDIVTYTVTENCIISKNIQN